MDTVRSFLKEKCDQLPEYVILDLSTRFRLFKNVLEVNCQHIAVSQDELIQFIISVIQFEKDAEIELDYAILEAIGLGLNEEHGDDIIFAVNAMRSFGLNLFKELQRVGIYQNGYLRYCLHLIQGTRIYFRKIVIDEVPT